MNIDKIFTKTILAIGILCFSIVNAIAQPGGYALGLDGTNDYVDCGNDATVQLSGSAITLEAWIYADDLSGNNYDHTIIDKHGSGGNDGYVLRCGGTNQIVLNLGDGTSFHEITSASIATGQWHHVAGVYDGTFEYLYVNGELVTSANVGSFSISNDAANLAIGSGLGVGGRYFNGKIDEARIWNVARTEAQIKASMYKAPDNTTGLVAYYQMSDGSGTSLTDNSTNSNTGTLTNGPTWASSGCFAGPGNALDFDGANDYVTIADNASLDLTGDFTLEAWIYPNSFPSLGGIISKHASASANGFTLRLSGNNPYSGISFNEFSTATGILTADTWYHIAAVKSGTDYIVYVNGVEEALTGGPNYTESANSDPVNIGVDYQVGGARYFDGGIDEVRIWNTARSQEEISETMMNTLDGNEANLVAYYRMDLEDGTNLFDITGNGHNGTLTNMEDADWTTSTAFNTWLGGTSSSGAEPTNWSRGTFTPTDDNIGIYSWSIGNNINMNIEAWVNNAVVSSTATTSQSERLLAWENLIINNTSTYSGQIDVIGDFIVNGDATFEGFLSLGTNLTLNGNVTLSGITQVGDDLTINATPTIQEYFLVTNDLIVNSDLTFPNGSSTSIVYGETAITGNTIINGSTTFTGVSTFGSDLTINEATSFSNNFSVTNNMYVNGNVSIPSSSSATTISGELQVSSGNTLTLQANSKVTVSGNLTNAGSVAIKSPTNSGTSGSLITNGSISNTGTMSMERWVSKGTKNATDYNWHSMGLPIASTTSGTHFTGDFLYTYDEPTDNWTNVVASDNNLTATNGFIVKPLASNKTYTFSGTFNTGNISTSTLDNTGSGYHLLSNPYPSPIDLEALNTTNIGNTYYVWDPSTENYITYNTGTSTGTLGRYILPCQGFFATTTGSGSITFENNDRTHSTANTFKSVSAIPQIELKVTGEELNDHLYINNADFDNTGFKMFSMNPETPQIYAIDNDKNFCHYNIQQMAEDIVVPIGFKTTKDGTYTIETAKQTFSNYNVILKDNLTGTENKLGQGSSFSFDHLTSNNEGRFELRFSNITGIETNSKDFIIFASDKTINISTDITGGNIRVYNINGQEVFRGEITSTVNRIPIEHTGIYIVKVVSGNQSIVEKIVINE